jgi:hypothetical protein
VVGEWGEANARAPRTPADTPTWPTVAGHQGYASTRSRRVEPDRHTWPSATADVIYVVLAADTSPSDIQAAIKAFPTGT